MENMRKRIKIRITANEKDFLKYVSRPTYIGHKKFGKKLVGFIDFMLKGKTLTEYTNIFSPNNFKKNDDIILNYFMDNISN